MISLLTRREDDGGGGSARYQRDETEGAQSRNRDVGELPYPAHFSGRAALSAEAARASCSILRELAGRMAARGAIQEPPTQTTFGSAR